MRGCTPRGHRPSRCINERELIGTDFIRHFETFHALANTSVGTGRVSSLSPGHEIAAPLTLRAEKALDLLFDFVHLRESIERMFGEELLLIQEDLKGARLTGRNGHASEMRVEIVQEILRQTGGSGEIASGRAVLDAGVVLVRIRGVGVSHTVSFLCESDRGRAAPRLPSFA